jgi:transposase
MTAKKYFTNNDLVIKKQYDALKDFFYNGEDATSVAKKYDYKLSTFYSLSRDFKKHIKSGAENDFFFQKKKAGRKHIKNETLDGIIIKLRKKNFSTKEILTILHSKSYEVSYTYVYTLLKKEGFARLPRRSSDVKKELPKIEAPKSKKIELKTETFNSDNVGLLSFLVLLKRYKISDVIEKSLFPETKTINRLSSILSFVALKLSNVRRYSVDDIWCMDRGSGLFAGLNVLPKTAWFSSYSHRVTKEMNLSFLKSLHQIWLDNNLLSDTINLDFTTIPYWGDDQHLENNWSGKRNKALASMLAVLCQDPDSGIIDYGDADIRHENQSKTVLEFLDFYSVDQNINNKLKYLVFDSKFTTYENLSKLNKREIKFLTIRMRGKNIVDKINNKDKSEWKKIRVECADVKKRNITVLDETVKLSKYEGDIRQIAIKGHGKIKPALIITNDFDLSLEMIVRKYAKRWIVEKVISEQIEFFHLNRVSSSMVIKVDFDLTMTILAHNMYRLIAKEFERYANLTSVKIHEKFINNSGTVKIQDNQIVISLNKKRDLPLLLETMKKFENIKIDWLGNKKIIFEGSSTT